VFNDYRPNRKKNATAAYISPLQTYLSFYTEHTFAAIVSIFKRIKVPNYGIIEMNNRKYLTLMVFGTILALTPSGNLHANRKSSDPNPCPTDLKGWKTNTAKRTIELNELISGGRAILGKLKGKQLSPVVHGDYFAFTWLVFKPETKIYSE
jgi:hypothetical protein